MNLKNILIFILLIFSLFLYFPKDTKQYEIKDYEIGIHYEVTNEKNIDNDIRKIKEQGFSWIRIHISWANIEKFQGFFDFKIYDKILNTAKINNLKIIAIVGTSTVDKLPEWLKNKGGIDYEKYFKYLKIYIEKILDKYSRIVDIWQIENELNHVSFYKWVGWREGNWNDDKIKEILKILSNEIREKDDAPIMINVIVDNPNWISFLNKVDEWNISYDIIGIDYYPNYLDDFDERAADPKKGLEIYNKIVEAKKFNKKIIVAETGYSTYNKKHSFEKQAKYVEEVLKGSLLGGVNLLIYYRFKDGIKSDHIEENFGLIDYKNEEKEAWKKIKELTENKINLEIKALAENEEIFIDVEIEELKISLPLKLTFPSTLINLKINKEILLKENKFEFEKILINGNKNLSNEIKIKLIKDTNITINFIKYYPLKIKVKISNLGFVNISLKLKIDSKIVEIKEDLIYLTKGKHEIIFQERISYEEKEFVTTNYKFFINPEEENEIFIEYFPIYEIRIFVYDWIGNLRNVKIEIFEKEKIYENVSSNFNIKLKEGEYLIKIFHIYQENKFVKLIKDEIILIYIPNELILISLIILLISPLIFILIKRKLPEVKIPKYKIFLNTFLSVLLLIIIPYYGILFLSKIIINEEIVIYPLNGILLFGIPLVIINSLKFINKISLYLELLLIFFTFFYLYFIIGRAYYGSFGKYDVEIFNINASIDVSLFIIIGIILTISRGIVNFFYKYLESKK